MRQPTRPTHLSAHAEQTLHALSAAGLGHAISLGGALGLLHYLDYRFTHDVDAWWAPAASAEDRERVLQVIRDSLQASGDIRMRQWGEVVSIELIVGGKTGIAQHRPLENITDPDRRAEAASLRTWFTTEFLDALVD